MVRYKNIDEYIALYPGPVQDILSQIRQIIRRAAPEATETISYGVPAFDMEGKHVIFFAAYEKHISIYPRSEAAEQCLPELENHVKGKGTYQFPLDKPIPYGLIEQLLPFMVTDRIGKR